MATWADLHDALRRSYALDTDETDEVALTMSRTEGGVTRAQRVMVRHYQAWGREMIEIRSAFGALKDYDPATLLAENLSLPLGAIAAHGKYLVLVDRACLDDLAIDGVIFLMTRVCMLADVLEGRGGGGDRF